MPHVTWHLGNIVQKLMDQQDPPMTQIRLAELTGLSRGTIQGVLNNTVESEDATLKAIASAFDTSPDALRLMVNQLNAEHAHVLSMRREPKEREEDRDPDMAEAIQYGKRIARLPRIARLAIFNTIQAFEDALAKAKLL